MNSALSRISFVFLGVIAWVYIVGAVPLTLYLMWKQCGGFVSC